MGNYEFKAMRLIADVFDRNDLHYTSYSKCFDGQKHETIEVHFVKAAADYYDWDNTYYSMIYFRDTLTD